jgi:hypothetical protein
LLAAMLMLSLGLAHAAEIAVPTSPPDGKALLVLFRFDAGSLSIVDSLAGAKFLLDGKAFVSLRTESYSWVAIPPGRHLISTDMPSLVGSSEGPKLEVDLKAGDTYFIGSRTEYSHRTQLDGGGTGNKINLILQAFPSTYSQNKIRQFKYESPTSEP